MKNHILFDAMCTKCPKQANVCKEEEDKRGGLTEWRMTVNSYQVLFWDDENVK